MTKFERFFSMNTTNSKDMFKVNQLLPIMQEHFGQNILFQSNYLDYYVL